MQASSLRGLRGRSFLRQGPFENYSPWETWWSTSFELCLQLAPRPRPTRIFRTEMVADFPLSEKGRDLMLRLSVDTKTSSKAWTSGT